jgi:endo-1,4-beta-D-glucanase Y
MFSTAFAVLEIPNDQPKVGAMQWKQVLDSTWQGLIKRNIDAYSTGLIHRPKSETPGDAVSEGVGYGMLLALFANDQEYFDKIWAAGKRYMGVSCLDWRVNINGNKIGTGPASDADEDIGLALIFANKLVQHGKWNNTSEAASYASNAQAVIKCLFENQVYDWKLLKPGGWGAPPVNPGYFAPAWYRIFAEFDNDKSHTWMAMVEESYRVLRANPVYDIGMIPDWTGNNGEFYPDGPGYNPYFNGTAFFIFSIRILWRIANDYLWFEEPRAKEFLDNSLAFIKLKGGPSAANFYQLQGANKGELVPAEDIWDEFNGGKNVPNTWRYRREHSHLTVGQWLIPAMAVGSDEDKIAWSSEMAKFYDWKNKVDFFGLADDGSNYEVSRREDTTHNEMYFDQFLAWFGVSLMSGTWVNVVELLDNPVENTEGITEQPFEEEIVPIVTKNNVHPGTQINQNAGIIRLSSQNEVTWKIHNLQGKLLFSSNSKETSWNAGNFKGTVAVSAVFEAGKTERRLLVIR